MGINLTKAAEESERPPQVSIDTITNYEVVTLPHVYHAAKRANHLDSNFEMIGCMVAKSEEVVDLAQEQL